MDTDTIITTKKTKPLSNKQLLNLIIDYLLNKEITIDKIKIIKTNISFLQHEHLIPLFTEIINKNDITIPDKIYNYFTHLTNHIISQQLVYEDILSEFKIPDIPLIVYKGPATAHLLYPRPHLRPYKDIDLLIKPSNIKNFLNHLKELNFPAEKPITLYKDWHNFLIYPRKPNHPLIDLHTNLAPSYRYKIHSDDIFQYTTTLNLLPLPVFMPEIHLISLICHASIHQYILTKLNWLDIFLNCQLPLNWELIKKTALDWGILKPLKISLQLCEKKLDIKLNIPIKLDISNINQLHLLTEHFKKIRNPIEFHLIRTFILLLSNEEYSYAKNLNITAKRALEHIKPTTEKIDPYN